MQPLEVTNRHCQQRRKRLAASGDTVARAGLQLETHRRAEGDVGQLRREALKFLENRARGQRIGRTELRDFEAQLALTEEAHHRQCQRQLWIVILENRRLQRRRARATDQCDARLAKVWFGLLNRKCTDRKL